ncbi:hypothetical protein MKW98_017042 [Papaver atlanticum]|uniref:Prenylcysteine lyase domain-containing protein n=1 Tax=Papaver atlanticum TaxID=357466 RepID=A0AAD4TK93_9MAGN|nr:hypothetical protein MKW98_017042 [Papaver atlanticum]
MEPFIKTMLGNFLNYYTDLESRPVFEIVEEMLKWSNLYNPTRRTLQEELTEAGLAPKLISELITNQLWAEYEYQWHFWSGFNGRE